MRADSLDFLPHLPKAQVLKEYYNVEKFWSQQENLKRRPTVAMRLALSVFGSTPREGFVPLSFFAERDIQVYTGLPIHTLNGLLLFAGETTAQKIADAIFPKHRDHKLPFEERFGTADGLPSGLESWLEPVLGMIKRIKQDGWNPPPVSVLNFRGGNDAPWIIRAEHLCGQVMDGNHRVLAYAILGLELPDRLVYVRVLSIHPVALAVINCLTMVLRLFMDPLRTPAFIKKRFGASARFIPLEKPFEKD